MADLPPPIWADYPDDATLNDILGTSSEAVAGFDRASVILQYFFLTEWQYVFNEKQGRYLELIDDDDISDRGPTWVEGGLVLCRFGGDWGLRRMTTKLHASSPSTRTLFTLGGATMLRATSIETGRRWAWNLQPEALGVSVELAPSSEPLSPRGLVEHIKTMDLKTPRIVRGILAEKVLEEKYGIRTSHDHGLARDEIHGLEFTKKAELERLAREGIRGPARPMGKKMAVGLPGDDREAEGSYDLGGADEVADSWGIKTATTTTVDIGDISYGGLHPAVADLMETTKFGDDHRTFITASGTSPLRYDIDPTTPDAALESTPDEKLHSYVLRVPKELWDKIKALSDAAEWSINRLIRETMQDRINGWEGDLGAMARHDAGGYRQLAVTVGHESIVDEDTMYRVRENVMTVLRAMGLEKVFIYDPLDVPGAEPPFPYARVAGIDPDTGELVLKGDHDDGTITSGTYSTTFAGETTHFTMDGKRIDGIKSATVTTKHDPGIYSPTTLFTAMAPYDVSDAEALARGYIPCGTLIPGSRLDIQVHEHHFEYTFEMDPGEHLGRFVPGGTLNNVGIIREIQVHTGYDALRMKLICQRERRYGHSPVLAEFVRREAGFVHEEMATIKPSMVPPELSLSGGTTKMFSSRPKRAPRKKKRDTIVETIEPLFKFKDEAPAYAPLDDDPPF